MTDARRSQAMLAEPPAEAGGADRGPLLRGSLRRAELPAGCAFAPRCDHARETCAGTPQSLAPVGAGPRRALFALLVSSPVLGFLLWPHPEVLSFAMATLALVAGALQTKYLNILFEVGRGSYADLAALTIAAVTIGFVVPVAGILAFGKRAT